MEKRTKLRLICCCALIFVVIEFDAATGQENQIDYHFDEFLEENPENPEENYFDEQQFEDYVDAHEFAHQTESVPDPTNATALYEQALYHIDGIDGPRDEAVGMNLMKEAASLGSPEALIYLVDVLKLGKGRSKEVDLQWLISLIKKYAEDVPSNKQLPYELGMLHAVGADAPGFMPPNVELGKPYFDQAGNLLEDRSLQVQAFGHLLGQYGYQKNCSEAYRLYSIVARNSIGDTEARGGPSFPRYPILRDEYEQGRSYLEADRDGLDLDEQDAEHGNNDALIRMGQRRLAGDGVPRDNDMALNDFRRAAGNGDQRALYYEGFLQLVSVVYANPPLNDTEKAKELNESLKKLEYSAARGVVDAFATLGGAYVYGWGVQVNVTKGLEYLRKGAAADSADANFHLGSLYMDGVWEVTPEGRAVFVLPRNDSKAFKHLSVAYEKLHWKAPFYLARLHREGRGGAMKSCRRAVQLLKALGEDHGEVGYLVEEAYLAYAEGYTDRSLWLYLEAAYLGSENAQVNAAWLLQSGAIDAPGRNEQAIQLLRMAVLQGSTSSMLAVGDLYYYGRLGTLRVPVNYTEALQMYQNAAKYAGIQKRSNWTNPNWQPVTQEEDKEKTTPGPSVTQTQAEERGDGPDLLGHSSQQGTVHTLDDTAPITSNAETVDGAVRTDAASRAYENADGAVRTEPIEPSVQVDSTRHDQALKPNIQTVDGAIGTEPLDLSIPLDAAPKEGMDLDAAEFSVSGGAVWSPSQGSLQEEVPKAAFAGVYGDGTEATLNDWRFFGTKKDGPNKDEKEEEEEEEEEADMEQLLAEFTTTSYGHAPYQAYFNLGYMHEWGLGTPEDFDQADSLYASAAGGNFTTDTKNTNGGSDFLLLRSLAMRSMSYGARLLLKVHKKLAKMGVDRKIPSFVLDLARWVTNSMSRIRNLFSSVAKSFRTSPKTLSSQEPMKSSDSATQSSVSKVVYRIWVRQIRPLAIPTIATVAAFFVGYFLPRFFRTHR